MLVRYHLTVSGWVVGSLEILGSPASLVRSIGNGVSDFFRLPYEGLTRGPGAFVSGVSRGTSSFVKHISKGKTNMEASLLSMNHRRNAKPQSGRSRADFVTARRCAGTLTSITNLATSLARNMDRLSLDEEHYTRQEEWRRQLPESLGDGLRQGLSRLGISLLGRSLQGKTISNPRTQRCFYYCEILLTYSEHIKSFLLVCEIALDISPFFGSFLAFPI